MRLLLLLLPFVALTAASPAAPLAPRAPQPTPEPLLLAVRQLAARAPLQARQSNIDQAPNPLSSYPPPSFPSDIASCPKCQAGYPGLSSCMAASSVFMNATSIFNSPMSYISVVKCACTDTFQAVYPQCVDCFQKTNQCWWLGTDPAGTGAGTIVTNMRSICGLGSALLGGVAAANNATSTVSSATFSAVTTGAEYQTNQAAGPIFASDAPPAPIVAGAGVFILATLASAAALILL